MKFNSNLILFYCIVQILTIVYQTKALINYNAFPSGNLRKKGKGRTVVSRLFVPQRMHVFLYQILMQELGMLLLSQLHTPLLKEIPSLLPPPPRGTQVLGTAATQRPAVMKSLTSQKFTNGHVLNL